MTKKGIFITFEGADGCGKSTQLKMAHDYLTQKGLDAISTRDPGGTPLGQKIREILLHHDGKIADYCELYLYLADRAQHVEEKIIPALKQGKIVLCDRYMDSTLAYQGYARGLDKRKILELNSIASKSLVPDLTFVFDVTTEIASDRVGQNKDRLESEGAEFHKKVRFGFLDLAKHHPDRIKIIDADTTIEEVHSEVVKVLSVMELNSF